MSPEPLRASVAARRLGVSTSHLLRLVHDRQIRFVMVDGIAHILTTPSPSIRLGPRRDGAAPASRMG